MDKPLIIVESPTKVKTIKKYVGNQYNVAATMGHIRDLPKRELGIDVENGFTPKYVAIPGKQKVTGALKKAAGKAEDIYLAPDPDREGEAIAWHTAHILKQKGRRFHRVLFHELTKTGILDAMKAPEPLNRPKYEAQQARRILDRIVGYKISPLLWRKVKSGLSAGRVQSVAVRIICERERAIMAFTPEEYWSITTLLKGGDPTEFNARLVRKNGKKLTIPNGETADAIEKDLSGETFKVAKVIKKTIRKNPLPPFTTSKLQQEAIRRLRFSAKKTMIVAQQLYEGVELGGGDPVGLITYMRTDSVRIAAEAAEDALSHIRETLGDKFALDKPRFFSNKKKVQDAHEAIRPTSTANTPEKVAQFLSKDQLNLYKLIWQRFVASQMAQALIDQVSVQIDAGPYQFTTSGSTVRFPGFMALYMSADQEAESSRKGEILPELNENQVLSMLKLEKKQHFTQPPPRFSEASLVKELEENGIGRPSTYAAILSTIREKEYVVLEKGSFKPTELGFIVNDLLVGSFPDVVSVEFTARMEDDLDKVETAEAEAAAVLSHFYDGFEEAVERAASDMVSVKGVGLSTELKCPECNGPLNIKAGKNGLFLACAAYPECRFTSNYVRDEKGAVSPVIPKKEEPTDTPCPRCGKFMVKKEGRYGAFLACTGYPECKSTQSVAAVNGGDTGVPCPEEGCSGSIVEKTSKRGKTFFGCNRYPECSFAVWDRPVSRACDKCGSPIMLEKTSKKAGRFLACPDKACGHRVSLDEGESE